MKNYNKKEIDDFGNVDYYLDDKFHRIDGPAMEFSDGSKFWYQNGQLHRIDGPAVEYSNGSKSWFYYGKLINVKSQKEFEKYIKTLMLR